MNPLSEKEIADAKEKGDLSPTCYTPSEQQVALPSMFLGLALSLVGLVVGLVSLSTSWVMWIIVIISGLGVVAFAMWIWIATMSKSCIKRPKDVASPASAP